MEKILPHITHENIALIASKKPPLFKTYEEKKDTEKLIKFILKTIEYYVCSEDVSIFLFG